MHNNFSKLSDKDFRKLNVGDRVRSIMTYENGCISELDTEKQTISIDWDSGEETIQIPHVRLKTVMFVSRARSGVQ